MVDVVAEGRWGEGEGVKPLKGGSAGRGVHVEEGGKDVGVGEGTGGQGMGEEMSRVGGRRVREVVGGVAVWAEKEGGGVKVGGRYEGEISRRMDSGIVMEKLAGVGPDVGRKSWVKGEGVKGAAREGAPYPIMVWNGTGRGGKRQTQRRRTLPRVGQGRRGQ